jgi:hypothetical protein
MIKKLKVSKCYNFEPLYGATTKKFDSIYKTENSYSFLFSVHTHDSTEVQKLFSESGNQFSTKKCELYFSAFFEVMNRETNQYISAYITAYYTILCFTPL